MAILVRFCGQLTDITECEIQEVLGISDVDELRQKLNMDYPALVNIPYVVAVDRVVVHKSISLEGHREVALLPPFSGG